MLGLLTTGMGFGAESEQTHSDSRVTRVVPNPTRLEPGKGYFVITPKTQVVYFVDNKEMLFTVDFLASVLRTATGYTMRVRDAFQMPGENFIFFNYIHDAELGEEGYRLDVTRRRVSISANNDAGFFYGVQTLLQLLPTEVYSAQRAKGVRWQIPAVSITDKPRFSWRGMHLDVSRHFFPKEFIKTYIDILAMHKMNVFHWHLTDDQGWRIEIKRYPRLTSIGSWRVDREDRSWVDREPQHEGEQATYGGFYTQEEIRQIVAYALARHITIVPEIEMPAHTTAALVAYPQFSCTGGPFTVPPGGVWPLTCIYCAGNDSTFEFLQNVLDEVLQLFPGDFIHIGGDEADKTEWRKCPKCQNRIKQEGLKDESELQSYFVRRIERFLISRGRRLIGWDEILEGGLAPEATVMSWRGINGGIAAARAGHDVVMSPVSHCYFDYYQGTWDAEPPAIGGYTPLSKVYTFEPVPDSLTAEQAKHILGAQANVWTEYIPVPGHAQYMTLPRMAAMAEVLWSPKESRDWQDFIPRVELQMKRYDALHYTYAKSAYLVSAIARFDSASRQMTVTLASEMNTPVIRYTLDGTDPVKTSPRYIQPLSMRETSVIRAGAFHNGRLVGKISEQKVFIHRALLRPVKLRFPYERYTGGGDSALTNGIRGSKSYSDGNWQGFHQNDLEGVIDLGERIPIRRLTSSYLQNAHSGIFLPTSVEYSVSDDGINFVTVGKFEQPVVTDPGEIVIREFPQELNNVTARYVKVTAKNVGTVPSWRTGRGEPAWLFADEIIVE